MSKRKERRDEMKRQFEEDKNSPKKMDGNIEVKNNKSKENVNLEKKKYGSKNNN